MTTDRKGATGLIPVFFVFLPNMVWMVFASDPLGPFLRGFAPNLALVLGLVAWSGGRLGVVHVLMLPFLALVPFETYYIVRYGAPSDAHILGVIAETNSRETWEYLGGWVVVGLFSASLLLVMGPLAWVARYGLGKTLASHRGWRWIGVAAVLPFVAYVISEIEFQASAAAAKPVPAQALLAVEESLTSDLSLWSGVMLADGYPLGLPFRLRDYFVERTRLHNAMLHITQQVVSASAKNGSPDSSVVVLVIGESARSDRWGMNGYARNTTPEMAAQPHAVSLSNVVSPWSATRLAVPVIMAGYQEPSGAAPITAASLVAVFRAAGWRTYWLSNQSPFGLHDSVISLHARQSDIVHFYNGANYTIAADNDDVLIEPFKRALLEDRAPRKLIVLHLLGSHRAYHHRYPDSFEYFKPSSKKRDVEESHDVLSNDYDNSIRFTDHVLGEVIKALETLSVDLPSTLLYLSDHGENLPNDQCDKSGHGHATEFDFRVAALMWISPSMQHLRPELLPALQRRRDAPFYSPEVFHTILDLAAINYGKLRLDRSWVSNEWRPSKRWTAAADDFDAARKEGACHRLTLGVAKH